MCPELILKQQYQGHSADLFALGIILFILYSGHPPFNSANPQDPHYRLLADGRADMFWKQHSKSKPSGFFSESFMDLISNMLQLNPCHRLSLADIVGHEWMQGPIADANTVRTEFATRQAKIKKQQADEARQSAQKRPTMAAGGKKVRALKTGDEDEQVQLDELPQLTLKQFNRNDVFAQDTVVYSTYRPDDLMKLFEEKCKDLDIKYTKDNDKFKIVFE